MCGKMYLEKFLEKLHGKTIAIVYIFEGEDAPGFAHYHVWKSDVISKWLNAVQELHCMPFILDVRTFTEKAINKTLPHIDYVVNLNCGSIELSPMGLIPSICGFLGIPCIPCDTNSIITGENKKISNLIAKAIGLNVPKDLNSEKEMGIYRPLNYGSSFGVKKVTSIDQSASGIYQEFINGYDITTPFLYNPLTKKMEALPTMIYLPNNFSTEWFFDNNAKENKNGYRREIISNINKDIIEKYLKLIESLSIKTFCRIDARIHCEECNRIDNISNYILLKEDVYFIEVNPMPTIKEGNSFGFSYQHIPENHSIMPFVELLKRTHGTVSPHGLLLACSILAYS